MNKACTHLDSWGEARSICLVSSRACLHPVQARAPCVRSAFGATLLNVPARLLDLLGETPQSGEALGAQLGVGRVTVHSWAGQLREAGHPLLVSRRGYALAPDTPTPDAVRPRGAFGQAYRYVGQVDSTQDEIRRWADHPLHPAPHGAVVLAEIQTGGRGRRGRAWATPPGALTFSLLLCQARSLPELAVLPLAAGVALHQAVAGSGVAAGLKWPNDLLAPDGRKLAGVLLEADIRGEELRRAVLGIGLNVAVAPEGAACLAEFGPVSRVAVLRQLLAELERWLSAPAGELLAAWQARNVTLGRQVRVHTPQGEVAGLARDVAGDGSLLVEVPGGAVVRIGAGDVQLVGEWKEQQHATERA